MTPHPSIEDIAGNLLAQAKKMGLHHDDLTRLAKEGRLMWQEEVYGRSWVLNGKIILMWNDLDGQFVMPVIQELVGGVEKPPRIL